MAGAPPGRGVRGAVPTALVVEHTQCYFSAVHNCINIRLRIITVE